MLVHGSAPCFGLGCLQKAFGGGDSSNALVEIKSYREPPRITYAVLQAVLMLSGHTEEQVHNWGAMRMLTKYTLIKKLVKLKPAQVPERVFKAVRRLVKDTITKEEVGKESKATLALYTWLQSFTRLVSVGMA